MSYLRLLAMGTASLLMITACSKAENAVEVADIKSDNSLFDYVPSDTPYLAGNLEPTPNDVIESFLQRFQPALEAAQSEVGKARQALENDALVNNEADSNDQSNSKLEKAILQELDGKLSRQGMESLGFDLRSHKVLYGMGVFPVLRIGLSDAGALRTTIERVLSNAEIKAPELEFQGTSYWRLGDGGTQDEPVSLYVSVLADHLAIGIFPPMAETELLPAFLGLELPGNSNAASRLAELNAEHGYTSYGSGILDLDRLLEEFINPDTVIARMMKASGESDPADMTPECINEYRSIVSNAPRMTVGTLELTPSAIAIQYRVETKATLAQQLVGLVADIPAANPQSNRILEFSLGMRLGAARDFLRERPPPSWKAPLNVSSSSRSTKVLPIHSYN